LLLTVCVWGCVDAKVRKLEHQVQHLTESQRRSEERQAKLKDENGHFVERLDQPCHHWLLLQLCMQLGNK